MSTDRSIELIKKIDEAHKRGRSQSTLFRMAMKDIRGSIIGLGSTDFALSVLPDTTDRLSQIRKETIEDQAYHETSLAEGLKLGIFLVRIAYEDGRNIVDLRERLTQRLETNL